MTEDELCVKFPTTLTDDDGNVINTEFVNTEFYFVAYPLGAIEKTLETTVIAKIQRDQYVTANVVTEVDLESTSIIGAISRIINSSELASTLSSIFSQFFQKFSSIRSSVLLSSAYAATKTVSSSSSSSLSSSAIAPLRVVTTVDNNTYVSIYESGGSSTVSSVQTLPGSVISSTTESTDESTDESTGSTTVVTEVTYYYEDRFSIVGYADVPELNDPVYANGHPDSNDMQNKTTSSRSNSYGLTTTTYTSDTIYYENPYNFSGALPKYIKRITNYMDYSGDNSNNPSSFSSFYMEDGGVVRNTIQQQFRDLNKYFIEGADTLRGDYISEETFRSSRKSAIAESLLRFLQGEDEKISLTDESNRSNGYITTYNYCKGLILLVQKDLERGYEQVVRENNKKTLSETNLTLKFEIDGYSYDTKEGYNNSDSSTSESTTADPIDEYLEYITTSGKGAIISDSRNLIERMSQYQKYPLGYIYLEYLKNLATTSRTLDDTTVFNNVNMGYYNKTRKELKNQQKTYVDFSDILEKYADMVSRFYDTGSQYYFDAINHVSSSSSSTGYTKLFSSKFTKAKENNSIDTSPTDPTVTYKSVYFSDTDQDVEDLIYFLVAGGSSL